MPMRHEQEIENYILDGMARALWVHAYMIWATEVEPPPVLHGDTWAEVAPNNRGTQRASMRAAEALAELYAKANGLDSYPLAHLFAQVDEGGPDDPAHATQADRARAFGSELALLAVGSRDRGDSVLWRSKAPIPGFEVVLNDDGDAISWDGGFSWERERGPLPVDNPPGEVFWSVLANGVRVWEIGDDAQAALKIARQRYGPSATLRLETGPEGEPVRTGDCPAPRRQSRRVQRAPEPIAPPEHRAQMSLTEFARAVHEAMPAIHQEVGPSGRDRGRFGPDKVFIAAIWRQLSGGDPRFREMTIGQFKRQLVDANRDRLLDLARADMVGAMEPTEVMQSEILNRGSSFHFVLDPSVDFAGRPARRNPAG
jgi:hypothetical protein